MEARVLFIITGDPRSSHRPAEAIRIATGVGAWHKNEIRLYFRGPAVLALSEFADDFVEADNYTRYLPIAREWGRPVFVQEGASWLAELGEPAMPYQAISDEKLAQLVAESDYVLRF